MIFSEGFEPWGDNPDLRDHQGDPRLVGSNYVPTSTDPSVPTRFNNLYTYVVRDFTSGVDVSTWNIRNELADIFYEKEIAVRGGISAENVEGVLNNPYYLEEGMISNPAFVLEDDLPPIHGPRDDSPDSNIAPR